MKKKILIISYGFPDVLSPATFHIIKVVRSLVREGWEVTVFTTDTGEFGPKKDEKLLGMVPKDVKIIKVRSEEYYFGKVVKAVLNKKKHIYWPDIKFLWYLASKHKIKKVIREGDFDLIYSRAHPFTCHLLGLFAKNNSNLPLVSHFSDPWVDGIYVPLSRRILKPLYKGLEKRVINRSDLVVFVNEYSKDLVMKKYPNEYGRKIKIIPHGYDKSLMPEMVSDTRERKKVRMVFTGDFYSSHRTPIDLFRALLKLKEEGIDIASRLEILFVGKTKEDYIKKAKQLNLDDVVHFTGKVAYQESFKFINDADVLLVIDAPTEGANPFLPSKLIEYVAFEKMILGITPKHGASADFINNIGGIVADAGNLTEITEVIKKCIKMHNSGELKGFSINKEILAKYNCENTNRTLIEIFEEVSKSQGIRVSKCQRSVKVVSDTSEQSER